MSSYRDPLGVVIQPIPSWNLNNCAAITVIGNETAGSISECGLVNDSTQGELLVVWGLTISHWIQNTGDPFNLTAAAQLYGTLGLLPYLQNQPVNPNQGNPPGSGWFNGTSSGLVNNSNMIPLLRGEVNWNWPHDFPLCVVPPNFSLSVVFINNDAGAEGQCAANFFWEVTKAI